VAVRPAEDVLAMATMNFADEVVDPESFDEAPGEDVDTTKRELDMARQLIQSLTADFDPTKYHDEYRDAVLELIEKKAQGEEIVLQPVAEEPEKVPDLMAALEASLAAAKKDDGGTPARKRAAGDGAPAKKKPTRRAKAKS
jgi:DNA end-binding protein Ku